MKFHKLVRDKIPEIIRERRQTPIIHIANRQEYWATLKEKLKEEVEEFDKSENDEELADILEVMYAICEFKNIDRQDLEARREKKAKDKGKFTRKIILDKIE